ncbi:MAG: AAA family ATPase [Blautia sp.]|nr:AAA family ATPase [Blautia sp.]
MALSSEEKSPDLMEGLLVDIRKIREMVEADFHAIDLEAERELARSRNGLTDPEAANEETGAASGNPAQEIQEEKPKEPEKSGMEELEELIGLTTIKEDVKELVALMKAAQLRKDQGMKTVPVSLHLVFSGNPGTGKTTVARILAKLYKEIGVLSKGQLVEVDRSGLVAGFVGQTAIKTQEKIKEALGGILFIDEAYTLSRGAENDFGQEAIDTILKAMEDHRDDFVVIVAGYTNLMEKFIHSNPGLKSRFNKFIEFPDYTADELQGIFDLQCKKYEYTLDEEAKELISAKIREMEQNKGENFANAREVRNLFEALITNQAFRISAMENPGPEELRLVTREDVVKDERKTEEEAHDN